MKREYFSIAPMVDVSDKYFRWVMRKLSRHAVLYTEMINENALAFNVDYREKLLSYMPMQNPVVC